MAGKSAFAMGGAATLVLATAATSAQPRIPAANCARTSTGYAPLTDLKRGRYHGFMGGLYANGRNAPSARYLKRGVAAMRKVKPLGPDGSPSPAGKVVLLSIGMSNTTQEFSVFKQAADRDPWRSPQVVIVDGAQGGQDAERIKTTTAPFWTVVDGRLAAAGVSARQVQVVWLKEAIAGENEPFPADARRLQGDLRAILGIMRERYPNVRLVYLSSRIYAGYATTALNPEPFAYQSGFAVKWTVQDRATGRIAGAWVGWGPYLWTDGTRGRSDGLKWACSDVGPDGTHPSPSGAQKVANLLLRFFTSNATAKRWFVKRS
jgi:hypothetical protein